MSDEQLEELLGRGKGDPDIYGYPGDTLPLAVSGWTVEVW